MGIQNLTTSSGTFGSSSTFGNIIINSFYSYNEVSNELVFNALSSSNTDLVEIPTDWLTIFTNGTAGNIDDPTVPPSSTPLVFTYLDTQDRLAPSISVYSDWATSLNNPSFPDELYVEN
jgi:hypothetical protein